MLNQLNRTLLCLANCETGADFIREANDRGCKVYLLTSKSQEQAAWPKEALADIYYFSDNNDEWDMNEVIRRVSFLARTVPINRIIALDDLSVARAINLREHFHIAGMSETTSRYFRDKLAMRMRAADVGLGVPEFVHMLNHEAIRSFISRVPFPYIVKPRFLTGTRGIRKVSDEKELWKIINELGDRQSYYLIERFIQGTIFHVDSIIYNKEIEFSHAYEFGFPTKFVNHQGNVFCSRTVEHGTLLEQTLLTMNRKALSAYGALLGVSHAEIIKGDDGRFYFLAIYPRVGESYTVEMIEAADGINLWREWAKMEILGGIGKYIAPDSKNDHAGLLISHTAEQHPDLSVFNNEEVSWQLEKDYHAGVIICSPSYSRISELLNEYTDRFNRDLFTSRELPDNRESEGGTV